MTTVYAPKTPDAVLAAAALAGARHFGSEAVMVHAIAQDRLDQAWVSPILGRHAGGWNILGEPVLVTVNPDGSTLVEVDA